MPLGNFSCVFHYVITFTVTTRDSVASWYIMIITNVLFLLDAVTDILCINISTEYFFSNSGLNFTFKTMDYKLPTAPCKCQLSFFQGIRFLTGFKFRDDHWRRLILYCLNDLFWFGQYFTSVSCWNLHVWPNLNHSITKFIIPSYQAPQQPLPSTNDLTPYFTAFSYGRDV